MPVLFLGFVLAALFWILWAIAWVAVWAIALLAWPIAVVLGAFMLIRAVTRGSLRFAEAPSLAQSGALRNTAFDDYRCETMRSLDEERGRFQEFLDRLRRWKDKQEFDRFMAERRARPASRQRDASNLRRGTKLKTRAPGPTSPEEAVSSA
jgi:hypothetical protein